MLPLFRNPEYISMTACRFRASANSQYFSAGELTCHLLLLFSSATPNSIPGEQRWVRESLANSRDSAAAAQSIESNMAGLRLGVDDATESSSSASPSSSQRQRLPSNVLRKFPSSARGPNGASSSNAEQEEAVGMLIKVRFAGKRCSRQEREGRKKS